MAAELKPNMTYDEVVFVKDSADWLLARNDYFEKLGGKGTKVKTISDTVYGISFLLERDTKTVLIAINDLVATGYKGKRLWKSQEQEA